jgi:hypothetical protein
MMVVACINVPLIRTEIQISNVKYAMLLVLLAVDQATISVNPVPQISGYSTDKLVSLPVQIQLLLNRPPEDASQYY